MRALDGPATHGRCADPSHADEENHMLPRRESLHRALAWAVVVLLVLCSVGRGQPDASEPARQPPELVTGHTTMESVLSIGVLVFGAVILLAEIAVTLRLGRNWDAWSLKICGLTLVIVSGLFLIVAGYSQSQSAPMMGLLGSVAGYLLGHEAKPAAQPARQGGGPPAAE
jgi:hypothetical protein